MIEELMHCGKLNNIRPIMKNQNTINQLYLGRNFLLLCIQRVLSFRVLYYFQESCTIFTLEKWFFGLFNPYQYTLAYICTRCTEKRMVHRQRCILVCDNTFQSTQFFYYHDGVYLLWNLSTYRSLICQFKLEVKLFCCKNCIRPVDHGLQNVLVGGHVISHNELFGVAVDAHIFIVLVILVFLAQFLWTSSTSNLSMMQPQRRQQITFQLLLCFAWLFLWHNWRVTDEL